MVIQFNPDKRVSEIKEMFKAQFKNLKIEFYKHKHSVGKGSLNDDKWADNILLKDLMVVKETGYFEFDGSIKISELEQIMEKDFGIHIQIFRKYGDNWLQTITTDSWSLNEAEQMAEELKTIKH